MKQSLLALTIALTTNFAFALGSSIELDPNNSLFLSTIMKNSGVNEKLDGNYSIYIAEDVSCTMERMEGVSCVWKIKKDNSSVSTPHELDTNKAKALYKILSKTGLQEILEGNTSTFKVSKIECTQERFVERSCVLIK